MANEATKQHRIDRQRRHHQVGPKHMLDQAAPACPRTRRSAAASRRRIAASCGSTAYRIIDAGQRHQGEHQRPDDAFGAEAVTQHQPRHENADRPAGEDQVAEEGDQRQADAVEIEVEQEHRQQRHRNDADRKPDQAHDHQRDQKLDRLQRAHHQVAEIARPHLLEKRDRKAELAAKQDVPQDHRADQRAAGAREEPGILRDVSLQKAPGDDLQRRPIEQFQQPRP